jgi:quercetin dioxygenase-like cupin family protein
MHFVQAGDREEGHAHCFDHLTLLASGKIRIAALGKFNDFTAPHHIFIKAGVEHELLALEDNTTVHCIHAIRDGERVEDIVDPASVPEKHFYFPNEFYPLTEEDLKNRETQDAV